MDNFNSRLLWLNHGGITQADELPRDLCTVDFAPTAAGKRDVSVLVVNPENAGVHQLRAGKELDRVAVEPADIHAAIGLVDSVDGPALITAEGTTQFGAALPATGVTDARVFTSPVGDDVIVAGNRWTGAEISVGSSVVDMPRHAPIREVRPLAVSPKGIVYLLVHEVTADWDGTILVQPSVVAADSSGRYVASARYPIEDATCVPIVPIAISPEGKPVALVPTDDSAQLRQLNWTTEPVEPPWAAIRATATRDLEGDACFDDCGSDRNARLASCVPNATMASIANGYRYCYKYLDSTDIGGSCSQICNINGVNVTKYRTKPRYLTTAKSYYSVPYQWGGFHTVSAYKDYMQGSTKRAGDIQTSCHKSCASGVDCSGFVSRCWQRASKHTTKSTYSSYLGNISYSVTEALRGDIFLKPNSHVMMVDFEADTAGVKVWEATTSYSADQVKYWYRSWSDMSGYVRRRYDSRC